MVVAALQRVPAPSADDSPVELSPWEIEEFAPFLETDVDDVALPMLILERDVKAHLSTLVQAKFSQGDWGGELNDLLASCRVGGREVSVAFLLKGRSVPRVMETKHAGTRGDQVDRLFRAPAEAFVVQHIHQIGESIRLRAYELTELLRSRGQPVRCCFMDGIATARVLPGSGFSL